MALTITHLTTVAVADDGTSPIGTDEWHEAHVVAGTLSSSAVDFTAGISGLTSISVSSTASAVKFTITSTSTASSVSIIGSSAATASYTVTWPSSQGNASTVLQNNGSGVLSWASVSTSTAGGSTFASTTWRERFFPLGNEPPASNYATLDTRNSHPVLDFDDTTAEAAVFSSIMSTDWTGGDLTAQLAYSMTSTSTGTVGWTLEFERIGDSQLDIDSDSFGDATTITAVDIPATSGHVDVVSATVQSTDMDSIAAGEMYRVRVKRNVSADNATGDAEFHWLTLKEA